MDSWFEMPSLCPIFFCLTKLPKWVDGGDGDLVSLMRILNGTEGLAHKIFIHAEGFPAWAQGFADEAALAKFLDESFYADIQKYDPGVYPSKLGKEGLPQALSEHPKEFPTILCGVVL